MAYTVPQAEVHINVQPTVSEAGTDLAAGIFGGHAYLLRYSDSSEKSLGSLGAYDYSSETCYSWPEKPTGSVIDESYAKVYLDDALLKFHEDLIGDGGTVTQVAGYKNRIISSTDKYVDNGTSYARTASLLRDVVPGDVVKIRGVVSSVSYYLTSYVTRVIGTPVSAVIGTAATDTDNVATASASATVTFVSGDVNCLTGADTTGSASSYDGLKDGDALESYTIRVVEGSVSGDLTTATLKVTSASGNDDVASVTPAALASATAIGTRGATITFDDPSDDTACVAAAGTAGVLAKDLIPGQVFRLDVVQAFTAPVPDETGSTYTGSADTTYVITVSRGGDVSASADADKPQITVTTTTGSDISGPTLVTEDSGETDSIVIGTKGILVKWDNVLLSKGDRYTVDATATVDGEMSTLELAHSIPDEIVEGTTDLDLAVYIKKSGVLVSKNRIGYAPAVNYTTSNTEVCLKDGILATDSSWTSGGVEVDLPVVEGTAYVEYRAWQSTLATKVNAIHDIGSLDSAVSGPLHPDNPLKWGLAKALSNSGGTSVRYASVADPSDTNSWTSLISVLSGDVGTYGMVPLTSDAAIHSLFSAHATSMNSPTVGLRRVLWAGSSTNTSKSVVSATSSTDSGEVLATVTDDTNTSGTQYTRVAVPASNGQFITNNVVPGDVVRVNYASDGFGAVTYTSYVVDSVISQDELLLVTGPDSAFNTAQKIEVWHTYTTTERAESLRDAAGGYGSSLVRSVWSDLSYANGDPVESYFVAAASAGLRSGSYAHASMTRVQLSGFEAEVAEKQFTLEQLNILSGGGVYAVIKDESSGQVYSRHAVTTADHANIQDREEMVVSNLHSLASSLYAHVDPKVAKGNVTDTFFDILETEINAWIITRLDARPSADLGGPLRDGTKLVGVRADALQKDMIVIEVAALVPVPGNVIRVNLNSYVELTALDSATS